MFVIFVTVTSSLFTTHQHFATMVAKQRIRMANEKHSKNITQRGNVKSTVWRLLTIFNSVTAEEKWIQCNVLTWLVNFNKLIRSYGLSFFVAKYCPHTAVCWSPLHWRYSIIKWCAIAIDLNVNSHREPWVMRKCRWDRGSWHSSSLLFAAQVSELTNSKD